MQLCRPALLIAGVILSQQMASCRANPVMGFFGGLCVGVSFRGQCVDHHPRRKRSISFLGTKLMSTANEGGDPSNAPSAAAAGAHNERLPFSSNNSSTTAGGARNDRPLLSSNSSSASAAIARNESLQVLSSKNSSAVGAGVRSDRLPLDSKSSKRQSRMLDWRMDPEKSRSDFTVEISAQQNTKSNKSETAATTAYFVHKNILEFGIKASQYFASLFANQTAEAISNKVRIQLNLEAAEAFPMLLDYMYGLDGGEPNLTIANAAPLYYLTKYFEVVSLQPIILQFWNNTMIVDDLATCLKQAGMLGIEPLREIVVEKCADWIYAVETDSPLLDVSDSKFWIDVREKGVDHPNLLIVISEFCFRQKDVLDAETFKRLVPCPTRDYLPPFETAIKLLEVEKAVGPTAIKQNQEEEITKTQRILLESLTRDWQPWSDPKTIQDLMKKISPGIFSRAVIMLGEMDREEKEALGQLCDNASKGMIPTKLSVTGANITEMNGVYSRNDFSDDGSPQVYSMIGRWGEDRDVEFFVVCLGPPLWCMAVRNGGELAIKYDSLAFTDARLSGLPPMNGWIPRNDENDNSRPVVTYQFQQRNINQLQERFLTNRIEYY